MRLPCAPPLLACSLMPACTLPFPHTAYSACFAVYSVMLRKEAERRAERKTAPEPPEDSFAAELKRQWEARKKELELAAAQQQQQGEAR